MKAGTAQRIALNVLSSRIMIRLGRVYGGLMVDVQAANAKLARRSETMLRHLTGRSSEISIALAAADGSGKLAALLLKGGDLADAKAVLERAGGELRIALAAIENGGPA
jgi:N-acetylmuramic acid 6-phosphate etherase